MQFRYLVGILFALLVGHVQDGRTRFQRRPVIALLVGLCPFLTFVRYRRFTVLTISFRLFGSREFDDFVRIRYETWTELNTDP